MTEPTPHEHARDTAQAYVFKSRMRAAIKDFKLADADRDGKITYDEFHRIMVAQNLIEETDIPHYFSDLDTDDDRLISWSEFLMEYLES